MQRVDMNISAILAGPVLQSRIEMGGRLLHRGITHLREAPPGDGAGDKAACEIALLYWARYRSEGGHPKLTPEDCELLEVLETRLRSESVFQGLVWRPARVPMLTMGTALLDALGRPDSNFQALARRAWQTDLVEGAERSPYQVLEMGWSAGLLGVDCAPLDPAGSLLSKRLCPYLMTASDGYAFTHAVFYATDFGARILPPTMASTQLWETIEAGLLWCLVRFDFDLLGEFLLCAEYSRMPPTSAYYLGLAALFLTWDENGFVPDRALGNATPSPAEVFFAIYHANLVAMLVASVLIKERTGVPLEPPRPLASAKPDWKALAQDLLALSAESAEGSALRGDTARSGGELLADLFGTAVAGRLELALGGELLAGLEADLLLALGMTRQDPGALFAGLNKALAQKQTSATVVAAGEWLGRALSLGRAVNSCPAPGKRSASDSRSA